MNVRKRGLALLMCICMIFTLLPFSVFAEDPVDDGSHTHSEANGVVMDKRVEKTGEDTYKVTLEQYVTGTVTPGTVTPIDVVLVLDVSGSMTDPPYISSITYKETYSVTPGSRYDRNIYYVKDGDSYKAVKYCSECNAYADKNRHDSGWPRYVLKHTTKYTPKTLASDADLNHVQFYERIVGQPITKLQALKNAVNSFIDTIASNNSGSKIAIVKFAGKEANTIGDEKYKEDGYIYNYTQIIKNLTVVDNDANVAELKKAVTDLEAGGATSADYGLKKAQTAFGSGAASNDRQRVVIMFTDGEPNHGNDFDSDVANAAISNAKTLKSDSYKAKVYTIAVYDGASVSETLPNYYGIDRYMHLVSSNYPNAINLSNTGDGNPKGGYYKVAKNEKELSDAFTQIGDAVGNPAITLGDSAVLTDNVAPNFKAPANAMDVKVYTAAYNGTSFGERTKYTGATVNISQNGAVTVTGFDYSANFVSDDVKTDGTYGKKLIVEFTIKVDRTKTYGGTQPTNAGANIKLNNEVVAYVDNPTMPVSITNGFSANYNDSKFYDGKGFDVKAAFEKMLQSNGLTTANNMNQYVDIAYEVKSGDTVVGTYTVKAGYSNGNWSNNDSVMTDSAVGTYTYNVTCKVTDKNNGSATYKTGVADGTGTMTLTILDTLTVSGTDYNVVYDGQEHGTPAVAKIGDKVVTDGVTISYKVGDGEWTTDVPTVKDVADSTKVQVKAEKAGYTPAEATYTLNVTPRNVTLTSESATKAYDGTPLTKPVVTVGGDGFVDGEVSDIMATGTVTNSSEGEVTNTIVYTKNQNYKDSNYSITMNEGKLSIYDPTDAVATIEANKWLDGDAPSNGMFSFRLVNVKDNSDVAEATNTANGSVSFSKIYSSEGTYIYKLSEVVGTDTGIVYDETVYYVKVEVTLVEKEYEAKVSYFKDEACTVSLTTDFPTFNNTTKPTGSLTISKTVSGNAASTTKEFTFTVTLMQNGDTPNNEVTFGDVTFINGVATFKLKARDVKTINGLPDGIRYTVQELDSNGYTVSAKVNDDPVPLENNMFKGNIVAGAETKVVFNNHKSHVYPPNPPIMDEIIVEITGNSDSVVYDGTEHSVKGYTVKISDPRYTEADFTFTGKAEASGINAGTYEMGLKAEQFKNTNARFTNVKFVIKADGVLTITPKDLTITAGSKTEYGPTPVTCDEWTVSGLAAGDKVESVKITGIQSVPGSSPNVPSDAVIKNAKGEDVTKNYAIKYVNGTLTMLEVLNKEDHFNYIIGTPEGLSLPTANVTRAEVATIFFRLMTDDARAKFDSLDNNFSDVAKGKWYNRAISTLANAGIIKGDPAGTYRPGDPITRAEMAAIIARFGDFKEGGKTFNDISGHWAQKYIELAASNGWINGNPDGTFKPNNNITRAETVAMINRVLDRQTKDVSDLLPVSQMTNWSDNMDTEKWYYRDMQEATNNHKAERVGNSIYEKWTEKLPDIDWASYQI